MHIYPKQMTLPPIKHRYLEYCHTKLGTCNGRYICIEKCTYTHGRLTSPSQSNIDALNTATPNLVDWYPHQSNEHRYLEYCYTKLGRWTAATTQLSIDCLEYHYIKLGRWTPQLKLSVTAGQVLADQCLKWEPIQNSHLHNGFTLCPALHVAIWCWAIGQVTHTFITSESVANLCKFEVFVVVFVLLMMSYCCCCVVYIITDGQQQQGEQQQQE